MEILVVSTFIVAEAGIAGVPGVILVLLSQPLPVIILCYACELVLESLFGKAKSHFMIVHVCACGMGHMFICGLHNFFEGTTCLDLTLWLIKCSRFG